MNQSNERNNFGGNVEESGNNQLVVMLIKMRVTLVKQQELLMELLQVL